MQRQPQSLLRFMIFFSLICVCTLYFISKYSSADTLDIQQACFAHPDDVKDVHLKFNKGTQSLHLKIPDLFLSEVSKSQRGPVDSATLSALYPSLNEPCILENGKYRPAKQEETIFLHIQAKPVGNNNIVLMNIEYKEKKWTKIDDGNYPDFYHYILPKATRPSSFLVPKKALPDTKKYFVECKGIRGAIKADTTPKCQVDFNYRDRMHVAAVFTADKLGEIDKVINQSTALLDKFIQD